MALAALPRRDASAREHLDNVARRARPVVLARDRAVPVPGDLARLLPGSGLARGVVVGLDGEAGAGITTLAWELAAAVTAMGEWVAAVDPDGTLGGRAALDAGVALERLAVVRRVPPARWAAVVAALLEGVSLVLADAPRGVGYGDARRLVGRARERGAVLVVPVERWPAETAITLHARGSVWEGLGPGTGLLTARRVLVRVDGRGTASRATTGELAHAG